MLETITIVLLVVWPVGPVTATTVGVLLSPLVVVAVVLSVVRLAWPADRLTWAGRR